MAVEIATTPVFTPGPPRLLFRTPTRFPVGTPQSSPNPYYDWFGTISPDGQRFAFQVPMPPEREVVTVAPEILVHYTGTYVNGNDNNAMAVTLEGNQLMLTPPGSRERFPLLAESNTCFFRRIPTADDDFEFVKDAKGEVTHFIRYAGGAGINFTRK